MHCNNNQSVLDHAPGYAGVPERFFKSLIKSKPIDDMLAADFPDPWYISSPVIVTAERMPWLFKSIKQQQQERIQQQQLPQSPQQQPQQPLRTSKSATTHSRQKTSRRFKSRGITVPSVTVFPPTSTLPSPTLPSPCLRRQSSSVNAVPRRQQDADSLIKWVDERLSSQPQHARKQQPLPFGSISQPILSRQPKAAAPPVRRSTSSPTSASRVQACLAAALKPESQSPQRPEATIPKHLTMKDWPHVLSQGVDEQDRMVTQHYILRAAFEDDFSAPVRPLLEQKHAVVLDMGCGPGTWAMEMATVFPGSSFIGIDISENYPRDIKPKNCSFYTLDIMMERLPLPDNSVDYIFQRDLNWDMPAHKWPQLMKEYFRVLKPGGWIECIEQDIESQSSQSMECNINDKLIYGMSMRHQDPFVARQLSSMLASSGFRRVESKFQSLSLGWDGTPLSKATMSQYLFTLQSLQPWLGSVMGLTPERYSSYIAELPSEWQRAHTYINWHCAIAQKP